MRLQVAYTDKKPNKISDLSVTLLQAFNATLTKYYLMLYPYQNWTNVINHFVDLGLNRFHAK